jgi:hypothetical protein
MMACRDARVPRPAAAELVVNLSVEGRLLLCFAEELELGRTLAPIYDYPKRCSPEGEIGHPRQASCETNARQGLQDTHSRVKQGNSRTAIGLACPLLGDDPGHQTLCSGTSASRNPVSKRRIDQGIQHDVSLIDLGHPHDTHRRATSVCPDISDAACAARRCARRCAMRS